MSEWKEVELIEVCEKIGSGATPRGGKEAYQDTGISLIRSQNVHDFRFSEDGLAYIDEDQANKLKNVIVKENDVLVNITGDSVARVCSAPTEHIPARVNQHVAIIRPKSDKLNWKFLKYFLLSPNEKANLLMLSSSGATRNALTKGMLENLKINLPPLSEQKAIAHILGTLDDKIALNRQMNQTLEAMAQALFKSWFVDFDPVMDNLLARQAGALAANSPIPDELQAMAEKRQVVPDSKKLISTNPELAAKFPSSFVFNETLGKWIPEGWEVNSMGEVTCELRRGISPKYLEEGGIRVLNQKCIRNHEIDYTLARRNDSKKKSVEGRYLEPRDMVVNSTGTGTLGRVANVLSLDEPTVVDSHVTVIRANEDKILKNYFNASIFSIENVIEEMGEGSTGQTELSRVRLSELKLLIPPMKIQSIIDKQMSKIYDKKDANFKETITLTQIRNRLLPELISGRVRLNKEIILKN